jgi:DGQHR domain-containing protein
MKSISNKIYGRIVKQNDQEFIIGVFTIDQVLKFTRYTHRLIVSFDENEMPVYNKRIQRFVEKPRVEKIADFLINDPLATFPTNIVLGVPRNVIEEQSTGKDQNVSLTINEKVFNELDKEDGNVFITIIDGQHRVRGIEVAIERLKGNINDLSKVLRDTKNPELEEKLNRYATSLKNLKNIQLVVTFFIDPSLEYQAMIFSTINRTQKRVSQNLVYSLFGLDSSDTPQKTALEIVLALNAHTNSPFYQRINLYGGEYNNKQNPPLSQATMVKSITNLICENAREAENDRYKARKELFKRNESSKRELPLRKYYAKNEDKKISDIFFYFFKTVQETFKSPSGVSFWTFNPHSYKQTNILQTTVGYYALIKILVDILISGEFSDDKIKEVEFYSSFLKKAHNLSFDDQKRYPFANKTKNILYYDLSLKIWPPKDNNDLRFLKLSESLNED